MSYCSPNEYLAEIRASLPGLTVPELEAALLREHTALSLHARFDTRPATAIQARLKELKEK